MLLIALAWLYMLFLSFTAGLIVLRAAGAKTFPEKLPAELWVFAGVCALSFAANPASLFFKTGLATHAVVLLVAAGFTVTKAGFVGRCWQQIWHALVAGNRWVLAAKIIGSIALLLLSAQVPSHGDSDFYHAQAVQWAEQYKVVPGLGNLFGRLAFNSALFPLQALFSFSFLLTEPLHLVNSFLVWVFFIWMLNNCCRSFVQRNGLLVFYLVFLFAAFLLFRGWISSVAPDIAAGIFTWVALVVFTEFTSANQELKQTPFLCIVGLCCFTAVTIKLSALPVLLLPLYLLVLQTRRRHYPPALLLALGGGLLLLPFLVRNIIVSGYLIYPLPAVDLFAFDWEIPKHLVVAEKDIIHAFARIPGKPAAQVLALSATEWLPKWLMSLAVYELVILLLIVAMPVVLVLTKVWKKPESWALALWFLLYAGIAFWWINAPSFRFGYGFLVPFLALGVWYLAGNRGHKMAGKYFKLFMAAFALMLVVFAGYQTKKHGLQLPGRLLSPAPYPRVNAPVIILGNLRLRVPQNDGNCGNAPIPCVNQSLLHPGLRLRGENIEDGFRIAQP